MSRLASAYDRACSTLKPQKQGTCGLYSFWYASLLLSQINPGTRPVIYPRGGEGGTGESLRHYAKHTIGSGQGEVQSCAEMVQIIRHFGYDCDAHVGAGGREAFITRALEADRPVVFPYMFGGGGPIYWFPRGKDGARQGGTDYGPHWSLIYREMGSAYLYIEPNQPNTPVKQPKEIVLKSNAFVDSYKYDRYWSKGGRFAEDGTELPYDERSMIAPLGDIWTSEMKYDIGPKSRQALANVLIAIR